MDDFQGFEFLYDSYLNSYWKSYRQTLTCFSLSPQRDFPCSSSRCYACSFSSSSFQDVFRIFYKDSFSKSSNYLFMESSKSCLRMSAKSIGNAFEDSCSKFFKNSFIFFKNSLKFYKNSLNIPARIALTFSAKILHKLLFEYFWWCSKKSFRNSPKGCLMNSFRIPFWKNKAKIFRDPEIFPEFLQILIQKMLQKIFQHFLRILAEIVLTIRCHFF